ncbi:hypothetical protein QQF64_013717 [Cirrhinus molitorella]|uniref:Uncharacterized protein n=1 Tax=Cirrhinus molitorella TaxID=172907 RepID=A0ABR3LUI8_9TELE
MVDEHKYHSTVSTAAGRAEKQKHLGDTQKKYQQQITEKEKKLWELKEAVEIHKRSAQTAVEDSERIFTELIQSIEKRRSEVTQMIRDQEKTVISQAEGLLEKLKQEIDELRRRNSEMEQLSNTHNHIHFLQSFSSLSVPPGSPDIPSISDSSLDYVGKSVLHLRQKLENICKEEIEKLSGQVRCVNIVSIPEYECRNDFIQYFHRFSLDPNTAHQCLSLSEGNTMMTERTEKQKHLGETQRKYQQQIKQRKKKLHELKEAVKNYKRSAQTAVLNSEMIFNQLINSIKRRRSEVTQMIRDQEKNEVSRAEGLMKQLEKEIDQMSLINAKLEQIPQTPDHIHFLQSYLSLPVPPGPPDVPKITERSFDIEKSVTLKSVTRLRQKLEDFCTEEIKKLSSQVRCIQIISPPGHVIKKKLFFASIKQQILEEKQYFPTQRETNYFTEERPSARSALSLGVRAVL